jgi:hypothetical protein
VQTVDNCASLCYIVHLTRDATSDTNSVASDDLPIRWHLRVGILSLAATFIIIIASISEQECRAVVLRHSK